MHNGLVSETRVIGSKSNGRKWELVLLTMRIVEIARVTTGLTLEVQEVLTALAITAVLCKSSNVAEMLPLTFFRQEYL